MAHVAETGEIARRLYSALQQYTTTSAQHPLLKDEAPANGFLPLREDSVEFG
jgi:hypothetical protein